MQKSDRIDCMHTVVNNSGDSIFRTVPWDRTNEKDKTKKITTCTEWLENENQSPRLSQVKRYDAPIGRRLLMLDFGCEI